MLNAIWPHCDSIGIFRTLCHTISLYLPNITSNYGSFSLSELEVEYQNFIFYKSSVMIQPISESLVASIQYVLMSKVRSIISCCYCCGGVVLQTICTVEVVLPHMCVIHGEYVVESLSVGKHCILPIWNVHRFWTDLFPTFVLCLSKWSNKMQ